MTDGERLLAQWIFYVEKMLKKQITLCLRERPIKLPTLKYFHSQENAKYSIIKIEHYLMTV